MTSPIYELAAQQPDVLREKVLGVVTTNRPVRQEIAGTRGTMQHAQWMVRTDTENQGSLLWLSEGQPIAEASPTLLQSRLATALAPLTEPNRDLAKTIDVAVTQTTFNEMSIRIDVIRANGDPDEFALLLTPDGVTGA